MRPHLDRSKYITVNNIFGRFEVCWDYQNAPGRLASLTQCERLDGYVDGFIDGLLVALDVPARNIHRSSSSKCTISDLEGHVALRLAKTLAELFQPLVPLEHKVSTVNSAQQAIRGVGGDVRILNLAPPTSRTTSSGSGKHCQLANTTPSI